MNVPDIAEVPEFDFDTELPIVEFKNLVREATISLNTKDAEQIRIFVTNNHPGEAVRALRDLVPSSEHRFYEHFEYSQSGKGLIEMAWDTFLEGGFDRHSPLTPLWLRVLFLSSTVLAGWWRM